MTEGSSHPSRSHGVGRLVGLRALAQTFALLASCWRSLPVSNTQQHGAARSDRTKYLKRGRPFGEETRKAKNRPAAGCTGRRSEEMAAGKRGSE